MPVQVYVRSPYLAAVWGARGLLGLLLLGLLLLGLLLEHAVVSYGANKQAQSQWPSRKTSSTSVQLPMLPATLLLLATSLLLL